MVTIFRELYQLGVWEFYALLGLAAFGIAIVADRFYSLFFKYSLDAKKFFAEIQKRVMADRIDDAIRLCNDAPLAQVIKHGLMKHDMGVEAIEIAINEKATEVIPLIERRTHYLSMVANASTMTGLLGTVMGMILCFRAVAGVEPSKKATILAQGISVAMNCTALSLIVAVPAIVVYSFIQAKSQKLVEDIRTVSQQTVNLFRIKEQKQEDM
ncbi:MAG: MotA/TolQ/ExbB proton channel family protein [Deltaproteobacteria bacterium]|nr:MotA/TolQ/ExbB proton channel family protein [Deltaproteobacteria bacterium]